MTGFGMWIRQDPMSTVAETKEAIGRLAPREYCELMAALRPFDDDEWDKRMRADGEAGAFSAMNSTALREHAAGRTVPIDTILGERP